MRLFRFAWRLSGDMHLAEDLAQETLCRAWRSRDQLRDPDRRRVWLFRICANLWRDEGRRRSLRGSRTGLDLSHCESIMQQSLNNPSESREEAGIVLSAMALLPERQREVLHLVACEELAISDVAEILGTTPGAVRSSLSLARQHVRQHLESRSRIEEVSHES